MTGKLNFLMFSLALIILSCNKVEEVKKVDAKGKQNHPSLILTKQGVEDIRSNLGTIPIFDKTLAKAQKQIDDAIEKGFDVPEPKDYSGGYSHETHKKNYVLMQKAGVLYQILDDDKYARFVKDMLFAYAKQYPKLPIHPKPRSYARGKLFWQCLNDSNWLVYTSQAYDCIYDFLSEEEREILETDLFRPFADHISIANPQFFNRVHNHATWGNVAVGMIALAMDDDELLDRALNGVTVEDFDPDQKDDDGGFIRKHGQKTGFFANVNEPFSPDGYFTEGPYYQRYASYPFLIFAQALQNKKPELKVFQYKDSVLIKSVSALLNLSNADGEFFLLNDAQKGMSYYNTSLVASVDIGYHFGGNNPEFLSIAKMQDKVTLDDAGLAVALGIKEGKEKPFIKRSIELVDGSDGDKGAVGILRSGELELVFKYTAHGLSHGHYDKLSFALFDDGQEVIQDYGMGRFVNIEQKGGGNYLKENTTWAKQSIAHNTLVQNETSHFKGTYAIASQHHSEKYIFHAEDVNVQVASAKEENAYKGTNLHRTMVVIKDEENKNPYVLDILKVSSDQSNQYDLPFYFQGQVMQTSFEYTKLKVPEIMGNSYGYQHLYKEASATLEDGNLKLNWLANNKFYTYTAITYDQDEVVFGRIGANDPEFNLRNEQTLILRKTKTKDALFVSTIESHGTYSPVSELAVNAYSNIDKIAVVYDSKEYTAIQISMKKGRQSIFIISNEDNNQNTDHIISLEGYEYRWKGSYFLTNIK
ncbi:alginate lyase family protein [Lutimonas zeaxanthinifaciens]|uniref:alginate lyase family protein n=1 Tax=Lutimonas zeaxanthinifaciens TaxID=3060215 RepID=UPI00265CFACB|nr:alginate lyase family protein [Lutimonas sp. YSD2104]WKK66441.1 alginate lyase family protein [Lutimonas sp. YSD2104]